MLQSLASLFTDNPHLVSDVLDQLSTSDSRVLPCVVSGAITALLLGASPLARASYRVARCAVRVACAPARACRRWLAGPPPGAVAAGILERLEDPDAPLEWESPFLFARNVAVEFCVVGSRGVLGAVKSVKTGRDLDWDALDDLSPAEAARVRAAALAAVARARAADRAEHAARSVAKLNDPSSPAPPVIVASHRPAEAAARMIDACGRAAAAATSNSNKQHRAGGAGA